MQLERRLAEVVAQGNGPLAGGDDLPRARGRPDVGGDLWTELNPASLETITDAQVEPALATNVPGEPVQFERQGYFCFDPDGTPARPIFNRTVGLRDSWAKIKGDVT